MDSIPILEPEAAHIAQQYAQNDTDIELGSLQEEPTIGTTLQAGQDSDNTVTAGATDQRTLRSKLIRAGLLAQTFLVETRPNWLYRLFTSRWSSRLSSTKAKPNASSKSRLEVIKYLFVVLDTPRGPRVISVSCRRPQISQEEAEQFERGVFKQGKEGDDVAAWSKIMRAVYKYHGEWLRYVPYYGPCDVQEVNFKSPGRIDCKQACYVDSWVAPEVGDVRKAMESAVGDIWVDFETIIPKSEYCDQAWPPDECPIHAGGELWADAECITVKARKAEQRLDRLDRSYALKICARRPNMAQRWQTLDGLVQESCLYDKKEARSFRGRVVRGLRIQMGWQWRRIQREVCVPWTGYWAGTAIVWAAVSLWLGFTSNLEVALAFGNVVAACIAVYYARRSANTSNHPPSEPTASKKSHVD